MGEKSFIGRKNEIVLFEKCVEAVLSENRRRKEFKNLPRILSFYGDSGVGKTSLAYVFENYDNEDDWEYGTGVFSLADENKTRENINDFKTFLETKFVFDGIDFLFCNDLSFVEKAFTFLNNRAFSSFVLPIIVFDDCHQYPNFFNFIVNSIVNLYRRTGEINFLVIFFSRYPLRIALERIDNKSLFHEQELLPFSFEEAKEFLNGFFAQFSDEYLHKIYDYTKGKPEQLQFLIDLVKDKKIPAEAVLNELIRNEGKILRDLKFAVEEAENLEHKVIAVMTHNLNQKFGALRNDFASLKKIVERGEKDDLADKTLSDFYQKLDDATNTFNNTYRILEKRRLDTSKTNLFDFLNEWKKTIVAKNFTIEISTENQGIEIEIDQAALKDVLVNLVNNAEKHGFKENKNYQITFSIQEIRKNSLPYIRILYKNNGKAFPKGFSFEDYMRLAGKSATSTGAGIGGYWIRKVINLHQGEWNGLHLHDNEREFPIEMEFILPQKQTKNDDTFID